MQLGPTDKDILCPDKLKFKRYNRHTDCDLH